jgi:hypothetical protein
MLSPVSDDLSAGLQPAARGVGPLFQRDYWAVIRECRLSPAELISFVRERFADFPPAELLTFSRAAGGDETLNVGDDLVIDMPPAGRVGVRVLHVDEQSFTLGTHVGHPEAGRITFGAYRNGRGDVIFHIRSRARSNSITRYVGFLAIGDPMQTNTWTDFIDRLAYSAGDGVIGAIQTDLKTSDDPDDLEVMTTPTFLARGT